MPGNRRSWAAAAARREAAAVAHERDHPTTEEAAVRVPRVTLAPRADGDTVTIILLQPIVGLGAVGDVLLVVQNAEVDALYALGWAQLYTGSTPPANPIVAVSTGPQSLTTVQQRQAWANISVGAVALGADGNYYLTVGS